MTCITGNTWMPITLNAHPNSAVWFGPSAMNEILHERPWEVLPVRQNRKARRRARALERGRRR